MAPVRKVARNETGWPDPASPPPKDPLRAGPSLFDRLAYVSWLGSQGTGAYHNPEVVRCMKPEEIGLALKAIHESLFWAWLGYSLERQQPDLCSFLGGLPPSQKTIFRAWWRLDPYLSFVPATAQEEETRLFLSDLQILLMILAGRDVPRRTSIMAGSPGTVDWRVLDAGGYTLQEYSATHLALDSLGSRLKVSGKHLGRLFRRVTGVTFHQYLRAVRIAKAATLLLDPEHAAKEIAPAVGYTDVSNFGRDFKASTGLTPVSYRSAKHRSSQRCPLSEVQCTGASSSRR